MTRAHKLYLSALFAAIKNCSDIIVGTAYLMEMLSVTRTPLNERLGELIARGLVTRSIDATNPRKRQLKNAVQLTPLGKKTKSVTEERKVSDLQLKFWRFLKKRRAASINESLSTISDPDVPVLRARRELFPWVAYLRAQGIIVPQNNGCARVKLQDQVFFVERDEWPDAPPWMEG